jgi:hypothetical protein
VAAHARLRARDEPQRRASAQGSRAVLGVLLMPGTNAGTGVPLTLKCRGRVHRTATYRGRVCLSTDLEATGRAKARRDDRGGARISDRLVEYRCRRCGHVGWSKHMDAERLLAAKAP